VGSSFVENIIGDEGFDTPLPQVRHDLAFMMGKVIGDLKQYFLNAIYKPVTSGTSIFDFVAKVELLRNSQRIQVIFFVHRFTLFKRMNIIEPGGMSL
jgi:hypothetical protein